MRFARRGAIILFLIVAFQFAGACQPTDPADESAVPTSMFNVASMRIHPIFTQIRDWTGEGKPDGIEVLIEFQDQFGDTTKATGRIIFELYDFRRYFPDPRGSRVVNPWIGSLVTSDEQREHWDHTSRAYKFQLAYPQIDKARSYVLTATFEREGGGRYFSQIILQPEPSEASPSDEPKVKVHSPKL